MIRCHMRTTNNVNSPLNAIDRSEITPTKNEINLFSLNTFELTKEKRFNSFLFLSHCFTDSNIDKMKIEN